MTGIAMSTAEKRCGIMKLIEINPSWSDRQIGRELGVDHKTVGKYRRELTEPNKREEEKEKKETKDEIIERLEKTIQEMAETLKETELKLVDLEERNLALMEELAFQIRIKNQK